MNGVQVLAASSSPSAISNSPSLLSSVPYGTRIPSTEQISTPLKTDYLRPSAASNAATSPSSAASENSPAWSSAIGHATTSGKSGRVIERLMTENDKLKRDLNEQLIKVQELEKSLHTYKPQIEALRQENDNLSHARGVDSSLISRRDRKIEELKAELAIERQRRERAEVLARQREREKEETEEQSRRDLQNMTDTTKHATIHAEILETSHKQLGAEYRARAAAWKHDLSSIAEGREQDRHKLARLDVVADQMRQELERSRKLNSEIVEAWEKLREEHGTQMRDALSQNDREAEQSRLLSAEMSRVVNEMRWAMGVQRSMTGAQARTAG